MRKVLPVTLTWAILTATSAWAATSIPWESDYAKGITRASQEKKWALVKFYTSQCPYCIKMDREVFAQPTVVQLVSRFVPIGVNAELDPELAAKYQVDGYPTTMVLDAEGGILEVVNGYVPADTFIRKITPLAEGKNPLETFARQAAQEPESATTQVVVGYQFLRRQHYARSRPFLEKGHRLASAGTDLREEALRLLVASFLYTEDPEGASRWIGEYRTEFPKSSYLGPMYLDLGRIQLEREDYAPAVASLTSAKDLSDDFMLRVRANMLLGTAKERLSQTSNHPSPDPDLSQ